MKEFFGVILEEIKGIVKSNGRSIADNSLRLMKLDDDVADVKKDVKSMSAVIAEMKEDVNILKELNLEMRELNFEQRKNNYETKLLLDKLLDNHVNIRRDIDNLKNLDKEVWSNRKVGVV